MQTSGKRSITSRPVADRTSKVAGLGLAVSLVFFGAIVGIACSPGSLPSDFPLAGGSGAGGVGGAGGGGGPDGGGGPAVGPSTAVADCPKFKTLGEADGYFASRCGFNPLCHGTGAVWTDLQKPNIWMRLLNEKTKVDCTGADTKVIDGTAWMKSLMLVKASQMTPTCPSGMTPGTVMPPPPDLQTVTPKVPALTPEEVTCISNFTKAASGK
jgi:hypothetical protein